MGLEMLNKVLEDIIAMVVSDDELCKLIGNDKENYLDDKVNPVKLLYNRIIPYDINFDKPNMDKIYLVIDWIRTKCEDKVINGEIEFKVMCNDKLWKTNSGLRPFLIMNRIDKLIQLQNKEKQKVSLGKILDPQILSVRPVGNLSGYSIIYKVSELRV